jgi:hypothetical protein
LGEIEIPREPALQETAEETTRTTVADKVEPGLLSPIAQQMETYTEAQTEPETSAAHMPSAEASPADAPMEVTPAVMEVTPAENYSASQPTIEPEPEPKTETTTEPEPPAVESLSVEQPPAGTPSSEAATETSDSDFEARVAAAMAAYNHAEAAPTHTPVIESPVTVAAETASTNNNHTAQAFEVAQAIAEPAPSFEYHPSAPIHEQAPMAHAAPAPADFIAEPIAVPPIPKPVDAEPEVVQHAIATAVEAAAVAAEAETASDHHNIAQAIHRVMERLKPELVDEIMRELKSKK